jgi:lysyl-tRNA synthetase class 2
MPSTVIRSFHYEVARRELRVEFQSGRIYLYRDVPAETFEAMRKSFSKGEFFNMHIRGQFSYSRLSEAER